MRESKWPFIGTEALASGRVTRRTLRSRHQMIYRNVYAEADGIVIRREQLAPGEICLVRGIPTTTVARTVFDLGRRKPLMTAIIRVDALANAADSIRGRSPRCPQIMPVHVAWCSCGA